MVAAGRARATKAALIEDRFAEPLVRAVGVDFFTRWATGELAAADVDVPGAPWGMQRMTDLLAARTQYFDKFLNDAVGMHPPGGDSGVGPGRSRLSAVLAGGNGCVRDRPAGGARVQGRHARGTEGSTNGRGAAAPARAAWRRLHRKVSTAIRRANRTSATMSTPIWRSGAGSRRKRRPISCSPTQACRRFRRSTAR